MKRNESNLDRILRVVFGAVLLFVGFGGVLSGTWAIVADIIGVILVLTGIVGFCPLYALIHISTVKK
jgi:hypothetical protein